MKKHLLAIALFALCTTGLNAASPKKVAPEKKGVETINRATAEAHIGFLACDELEGREAGWKGGRIAGNYIISCLKQMGIKPLDGDYIQPFDVYHAERQVKGKRWQVHPDSIAELKKVVYQITNYQRQDTIVHATLLIYHDKVIGGDISSAELDGFMYGFMGEGSQETNQLSGSMIASEIEEASQQSKGEIPTTAYPTD